MTKRTISLRFDSDLFDLLEKRASKSMLGIEELIEDIVRRSMLSYKDKSKPLGTQTDDPLVNVFSRNKSGRPRKR